MDPTIDPTMMAQINKGISAPMSPMTGGGAMPMTMAPPGGGGMGNTPPPLSPGGTGTPAGGQALPTASPGGGVAPVAGASAPANDMRNQIAASMQAQQMAQQNQQALAATRANPTGVDPLAQYQQGFQSGVTGQPTQQPPAQYWG